MCWLSLQKISGAALEYSVVALVSGMGSRNTYLTRSLLLLLMVASGLQAKPARTLQAVSQGGNLCPEGCSKCNILNECLDCNRGFYLQGTKCLNCATNCLNCDSSTNCMECKPKFELCNGSCAPLGLTYTAKTVVVISMIVMITSMAILSVVWKLCWKKKKNYANPEQPSRPSKAHLVYTSDEYADVGASNLILPR